MYLFNHYFPSTAGNAENKATPRLEYRMLCTCTVTRDGPGNCGNSGVAPGVGSLTERMRISGFRRTAVRNRAGLDVHGECGSPDDTFLLRYVVVTTAHPLSKSNLTASVMD